MTCLLSNDIISKRHQLDKILRYLFSRIMKLKFFFIISNFYFFISFVGAKSEKMSPKRILELWKLEDNRSQIPLGFEDWLYADEYKAEIIVNNGNGQETKSTAKCIEKIVNGKFIVYRMFSDDPIDHYGVYSYEKEKDLYHRAEYIRGKQGTEADGFERFTSFIGCRYPGTDIYSFTQRENNLPGKALIIEKQTKEHCEWRVLVLTNNGDFIQLNRGKAVPVRKTKKL